MLHANTTGNLNVFFCPAGTCFDPISDMADDQSSPVLSAGDHLLHCEAVCGELGLRCHAGGPMMEAVHTNMLRPSAPGLGGFRLSDRHQNATESLPCPLSASPPSASPLSASPLGWHVRCIARRAGRRCAPAETEEQQRLSTLHGRGLHAQAHRILHAHSDVFAFGTPPSASSCSLLCYSELCSGVCLTARGTSRQDARRMECCASCCSAPLMSTVIVHAHWCRSGSLWRWALCLRQALGHSAVGCTHGVQQPLRVAAMHHRRGRGTT